MSLLHMFILVIRVRCLLENNTDLWTKTLLLLRRVWCIVLLNCEIPVIIPIGVMHLQKKSGGYIDLNLQVALTILISHNFIERRILSRLNKIYMKKQKFLTSYI